MSQKLYGRYIVSDPDVCHGKPTFRGTRILVADVLDQVGEGLAWETIIEEWRGGITKEAIAEAIRLSRQAFLEHMAECRFHVVDVTHPRCQDHILVANEVLRDLGILDSPTLLILNKIDVLEEHGILDQLCAQYPHSVPLSAVTGVGFDVLRQKIAEIQEQGWVTVALHIPMHKTKLVSQLYRLGNVLEQYYDDRGVAVTAKLKKADAQRIALMLEGG